MAEASKVSTFTAVKNISSAVRLRAELLFATPKVNSAAVTLDTPILPKRTSREWASTIAEMPHNDLGALKAVLFRQTNRLASPRLKKTCSIHICSPENLIYTNDNYRHEHEKPI